MHIFFAKFKTNLNSFKQYLKQKNYLAKQKYGTLCFLQNHKRSTDLSKQIHHNSTEMPLKHIKQYTIKQSKYSETGILQKILSLLPGDSTIKKEFLAKM